MSTSQPSRPHWVLRIAAIACALTVTACVVMRAHDRATATSETEDAPSVEASGEPIAAEVAGPPSADEPLKNAGNTPPPEFQGSSKFATINVQPSAHPTIDLILLGQDPPAPPSTFLSGSKTLSISSIPQPASTEAKEVAPVPDSFLWASKSGRINMEEPATPEVKTQQPAPRK